MTTVTIYSSFSGNQRCMCHLPKLFHLREGKHPVPENLLCFFFFEHETTVKAQKQSNPKYNTGPSIGSHSCACNKKGIERIHRTQLRVFVTNIREIFFTTFRSLFRSEITQMKYLFIGSLHTNEMSFVSLIG